MHHKDLSRSVVLEVKTRGELKKGTLVMSLFYRLEANLYISSYPRVKSVHPRKSMEHKSHLSSLYYSIFFLLWYNILFLYFIFSPSSLLSIAASLPAEPLLLSATLDITLLLNYVRCICCIQQHGLSDSHNTCLCYLFRVFFAYVRAYF